MKMKFLIYSIGLTVLLLLPSCFTPHGVYHTVKPGQTLYTIARTYDVELYKLMRINGIKDPTKIKPGDKIFIPGATRERYVPSTATGFDTGSGAERVQKRKSGSSVTSSPRKKTASARTGSVPVVKVPEPDVNVRLPEVRKKEKKVVTGKQKKKQRSGERSKASSGKKAESPKKVVVALKVPKLIWPVRGKVVSKFGWRGPRHHDGIDISAPEGTPVRAAADGIVIYSGSGFRGYGNLIVIKHTPRVFTIYAHNKKNLVRKGQRVRQGQTIALVGSTGNATGPHLHFELRIGNKPVDPLKYLPRD